MRLKQLLKKTGDVQVPTGTIGVRVYHGPLTHRGGPEFDARYWSLTDYRVTAALSGPSIQLLPV